VLVPVPADKRGPKTIALFQKPSTAYKGKITIAFFPPKSSTQPYDDKQVQALPVAQVKQMLKTQTGKTMAQLVAASEQIDFENSNQPAAR